MQKIIPVILAGGFSTRLWPLSSKIPKQFNTDIYNPTLFQQAYNLVDDEIFSPPVIIVNQQHKHLLPNIKFSSIIIEPSAQNTSPAILSATLLIQKQHGNNTIILVLSSDHIIPEKEKFIKSIKDSIIHTDKNIILFGTKPKHAETGYGYIFTKNEIKKNIFEISSFTEKPNQIQANLFFSQKNCFWNCGILLFQANILIQSYKNFSLNLYNTIQNILQNTIQTQEAKILSPSYSHIKPTSIDYDILEKIPNIYLTKMLSNWCDIGSFQSLHTISTKDSNSNSLNGNIHTSETKNCLIINKNPNSYISTIGITNTAIINTESNLLICDLQNTQKIKNIPQIAFTSKVIRKWGSYEVIKEETNLKIKKLIINPQQSISLQSHKFRNENWFITQGTASVIKDNNQYQLEIGDSIFIPKNTKHQISNKTNKTLHIIEIQTGEYFGEDDIERYSQ